MKKFNIMPEINYGIGALNYIKEIKENRIMIVTDKTMVKLGLIKEVLNRIDGKIIKVIDNIEPNPTIESIEDGVKEYIKFAPECIIAIGGGSPIDACKGILYFAYKVEKEKKGSKRKIPFIAIPTTSGTGSEVTSYSVITNGNKKIVLIDDDMLPTVAILENEFMKTLPQFIVADTGMDALVHSIEAYVSKERNVFSNGNAMESIKIIYKDLINHYNDVKVESYRKNIQYASTLGGIAFNNAGLGINHSIAHTLGANLHISHGRSNAIIMPYVINYNSDAVEFYFEIVKMLGIPINSKNDGGKELIKLICNMKKELKIESSIKDLGISFKEYEKLIPTFINDIEKDLCTSSNPNNINKENLIKLLIEIYFGEVTK